MRDTLFLIVIFLGSCGFIFALNSVWSFEPVVSRVLKAVGKIKAAQNLKTVNGQWPDALLLLSGALQAGFNLNEAIHILMAESPYPLKSYLAGQLKADRGDLSLEERIEIIFEDPRLALVRASLLMAFESGSEASSILKMSSKLLRQDLEFKNRVQMLTVHSKMTAWIVGLSPLFLLGGLSFLAPGYVDPLFFTRSGRLLLLALFILVSTGLTFVHRMARVDI